MQKINYNENIELTEQIKELLMINIDKDLQESTNDNCIKISGKIKISGEASTINQNLPFSKDIHVEIMLDKDQLIEERVEVDLDDFDYHIENNTISINLILKIEGLKEIEPFFPAQEDQEDVEIDNRDEIIEVIEDDTINDIEIINEDNAPTLEEMETKTTKSTSLLNQIFKTKEIKKETCYFYHVVKTQTNYQEIAQLYNIDIDKLKSVNNDEEIYIGKLVLIPTNERIIK